MKTTIQDAMNSIEQTLQDAEPDVRLHMIRLAVLMYGQTLKDSSFVEGAQQCREMMARFVECAGDSVTTMSIRANWNPAWGKDPGRPKCNATREADPFDCCNRSVDRVCQRVLNHDGMHGESDVGPFFDVP